jgi:hypothetical protein
VPMFLEERVVEKLGKGDLRWRSLRPGRPLSSSPAQALDCSMSWSEDSRSRWSCWRWVVSGRKRRGWGRC